ncbi:guanine nucleotide-binding protein G(I)/G(S)/G(O) subunit gamma-10 [Sigmodon hispidus]
MALRSREQGYSSRETRYFGNKSFQSTQAPPRFIPRQRRSRRLSSQPQRLGGGAGAAASPPRGGTLLGRRSAQPGPPLAALAAMSSGASVSALQRLVEQLKLEAGVERIKVSQAAAELQQYCMQNACKDALLLGVPAGSNPFREPRSCALL